MPYGKLAEGDRVWTAVGGNTIVAADFNELQDQLKTILGPNNFVVPMISGWAQATWDYACLTEPKDPPEWNCSTATAEQMLYFPLPFLKEGMKITRFYAVCKGSAVTGDDSLGSISLVSHVVAAAAAAVSKVSLIASAFGNVAAWTLQDSGALTITVDDDTEYFLQVVSSADAPAGEDSYLLGAYFICQEGN